MNASGNCDNQANTRLATDAGQARSRGDVPRTPHPPTTRIAPGRGVLFSVVPCDVLHLVVLHTCKRRQPGAPAHKKGTPSNASKPQARAQGTAGNRTRVASDQATAFEPRHSSRAVFTQHRRNSIGGASDRGAAGSIASGAAAATASSKADSNRRHRRDRS